MGIGAQNCINKFRAKAAAHSQHNNQSGHSKGDANQADPGHRADATLGAFGPKIAPSNQKFKSGKGRSAGHRRLAVAGLWAFIHSSCLMGYAAFCASCALEFNYIAQ